MNNEEEEETPTAEVDASDHTTDQGDGASGGESDAPEAAAEPETPTTPDEVPVYDVTPDDEDIDPVPNSFTPADDEPMGLPEPVI